jgi:hypothetical protein
MGGRMMQICGFINCNRTTKERYDRHYTKLCLTTGSSSSVSAVMGLISTVLLTVAGGVE